MQARARANLLLLLLQVYSFHGCYYHGCRKCFKKKFADPNELHPTKKIPWGWSSGLRPGC